MNVMVWPQLGNLFDDMLRVQWSAGLTEMHEVDNLSPLRTDEVPPGFHSWAEKRKREYRCGRHHARHALSLAGGALTAILRDGEGVPLFPPGFSGSITHTGKTSTLAAAVVAPGTARVGIDAEELRNLPEDMVQYILSASEREHLRQDLRGMPPPLTKEGQSALMAFSAKEAFYKCVFPKLRCRLNFHDVEFRLKQKPAHGHPGEFVIRMLRGDIAAAPALLTGRFLHNDQYVICGTSWQS